MYRLIRKVMKVQPQLIGLWRHLDIYGKGPDGPLQPVCVVAQFACWLHMMVLVAGIGLRIARYASPVLCRVSHATL